MEKRIKETTQASIRIEGEKLSPKKIAQYLSLPIESIAEYGEPNGFGKYKGEPSPYGLGNLNFTYKDLDKILCKFLAKKKELKEMNVDDIEVFIYFNEGESAENYVEEMKSHKTEFYEGIQMKMERENIYELYPILMKDKTA